ncbi:MAG: APC family permease [Acidihalobacter sp.]
MAEAAPASAGGKSGDRLGTGALLSIGIGGMIGGGIFAVTGLTIELTRGAAPLAFAAAGVVALLTAWSYLKLTLRYPSAGGTVEFLNRAFGPGVFTGTLNILLCLSYVILLAVYAYAFGSYGAELFGGGETTRQILASAVLIVLAVLNFLGPHLAIRSENSLNVLKLILLAGFIAAGLLMPGEPARLGPAHWVAPLPLLAGAMVIFLNYEGFELIANAAPQAADPRRSMPIAYLGGVAIVLLVYMGIAAAVLLHLGFGAIAAHRDNVLSAAAQQMLGHGGAVAIVVAALAATASAINATFYSSGRLTYLIAKYGELPEAFEHDIRNQPVEGLALFAVLALLLVNGVPLSAIATLGSAGFLLVFAAVNLANLRLARETGARPALAAAGLVACVLALAALCIQVLSDAHTRWQIVGLAALIGFSLVTELIYRRFSGRSIHMGRRTENR